MKSPKYPDIDPRNALEYHKYAKAAKLPDESKMVLEQFKPRPSMGNVMSKAELDGGWFNKMTEVKNTGGAWEATKRGAKRGAAAVGRGVSAVKNSPVGKIAGTVMKRAAPIAAVQYIGEPVFGAFGENADEDRAEAYKQRHSPADLQINPGSKVTGKNPTLEALAVEPQEAPMEYHRAKEYAKRHSPADLLINPGEKVTGKQKLAALADEPPKTAAAAPTQEPDTDDEYYLPDVYDPNTAPAEDLGDGSYVAVAEPGTQEDPRFRDLMDMIGQAPKPKGENEEDSNNILNEVTRDRAGGDYVAPKNTFGRRIKNFMVGASGPLDFTRLERQERELHQQKNAMNDREKVKAEVASSTLFGAQKFNRDLMQREHETGGMTPQQKFTLDLAREERGRDRDHSNRRDLMQEGSRLNREEDSNRAELGGNSPEAIRAQMQEEFVLKFLTDNPDLAPEELAKRIQYDPEALKAFTEARNPTLAALQAYEAMKERKAGKAQQGSNPYVPNTAALDQ